jgi:hypothetical protein
VSEAYNVHEGLVWRIEKYAEAGEHPEPSLTPPTLEDLGVVYSFRHGVEMRAHEYGTLRDELDQALILLDMFREDANVPRGPCHDRHRSRPNRGEGEDDARRPR